MNNARSGKQNERRLAEFHTKNRTGEPGVYVRKQNPH